MYSFERGARLLSMPYRYRKHACKERIRHRRIALDPYDTKRGSFYRDSQTLYSTTAKHEDSLVELYRTIDSHVFLILL